MEYNFREIEKKWQAQWVADKTYHTTEDPTNRSSTYSTCSPIRREPVCM